jgi:hypothetical protein
VLEKSKELLYFFFISSNCLDEAFQIRHAAGPEYLLPAGTGPLEHHQLPVPTPGLCAGLPLLPDHPDAVVDLGREVFRCLDLPVFCAFPT